MDRSFILLGTARPAPNPDPALTPPARWGKGELVSPGRTVRPSPADRRSVSPVVWPIEKDVETMPTQKIFKQRVRTRMSKTGESYTSARRQLLKKSNEPGAESTAVVSAPAADDLMTSDEAMRRGSGKPHAEWFALLDAWGATSHNHTEIATWLRDTQGVPGWWSQNITVSYERARGMRARHQQRDGYTIGVTKTMAGDPDRILAAFTNASTRRRGLHGASMRQRPTRAALTARFDWSEPSSRVVVNLVPKADGKVLVAVGHEQIPDAATAERLKAAWRAWLGDLKSVLEQG
jgi:hypothetical protein